jgi:TolB-like protein/DNA-binding winged helix-turn-helix (wHTH) protein/Tfp pilus assembly protein PilF
VSVTETATIDPSAGESFRLDELQVDPAIGRIAGPGGTQQVDPRVMDVLVMLARTPRELVSRTQLLTTIWPGGAIYDDTLTQTVYQLRQHLLAAGGSDRYRKLIKTLPKRGYLLDCAVQPLAAATAQAQAIPQARSQARRRAVWLLAFVLLAGGTGWLLQRGGVGKAEGEPQAPELPANAIAVLPFANSSGDAASDYLSEGIADNIRDRIAALHELRVVARRSSVQFREARQDVQEVAVQLGVGRIIEGRFNRVRGRVTVSVELVDAASGFQMWSEIYEGSADELMLLEQALVRDLVTQLAPDRALEPESAPTIRQLAAHDLILLGRQYEQQVADEQRVDEGKLAKAIDFYAQAIAVDPDSTEAHARLGRMLLYQGSVVEAEPHILQALELDPSRGDTFTTLGLYYWAVREAGIGAAYRRAIELNPNDADALSYFAAWNWMQGAADEAVIYYRRALEVDPLSLQRYADLAYKLAWAGLRVDAMTVLERLLRLFPTAPGYLAAARTTEALGDLDEAIAWTLRARQLRPDDPEASGLLAELWARLGDFQTAARFEPEQGMGLLFWQRRYAELIELGEEATIDRPGDTEARFLLAFAYSALGRQEQAIRQMELAGMPATVQSESRRANEVHAIMTYYGALNAGGREAEARALAQWDLDWERAGLQRFEGLSWAAPLSQACALTVLDQAEAALDLLETLPQKSGVARLPWLLDLACFDRLQDEPRYQAVVAGVEAQIRAIRERVPATLARHGLGVNAEPE